MTILPNNFPTDYPDSLPNETYQQYIKRTKPFFIKKSSQLLEEESLDATEDTIDSTYDKCKDGFCSI